MNNQKVADLLRSVANLIDTQTEDNTQVVDNIEKPKEVEIPGFKKPKLFQGIPESIKKAMMEQPKPTLKGQLKRSVELMKKIDEDDKIRAYKTKINNQGNKIIDYLTKIDELRMEAVIGFHDESKEVEDHNTEVVTES